MLDEILPLQLITAKLAKSIARLEIEINSSTKHVCNASRDSRRSKCKRRIGSVITYSR